MTTKLKLVFILTFSLLPINYLLAQKGFRFQRTPMQETCTQIFFDADSLPFKIQWLRNGTLDSIKYAAPDGKHLNADFLLTTFPKFTGGFDSLKSFFRKNFKKPSAIETNGKARVLFLFLQDNIELRMIQRIGYSNQRFDYDKEIKRVLMLTKGKWDLSHLSVSDEPIIFIYYFSVP